MQLSGRRRLTRARLRSWSAALAFLVAAPVLRAAGGDTEADDAARTDDDSTADSRADDEPEAEEGAASAEAHAEPEKAHEEENVEIGASAHPKDELEDAATYAFTTEFAAYEDSDHVTVFTPSLSAGVENVSGAKLGVSYLVDVVSAASVDIVSTASPRWEEVRHAGNLALDYKPNDLGVGLGGSFSYEPDYVAYGGYARVIKDFDQKNWTLSFGTGVSKDSMRRCGGTLEKCTPYSIYSRDVLRGSFMGGLDLVLNPTSVLSVGADVVVESGDQSKPYRYVPMFAAPVAPAVPKGASIEWVNAHRLPERPHEQLPLLRKRFALTTRYSKRFGGATLRLLERGYYDSWGLPATTTDARFIVDLGQRFAVWPHGRFHLQKGVTFWHRAYVSGQGWDLPQYRTGDRELGPLWTAQGGLGVAWYLGAAATPDAWSLSLTADGMYTTYEDALYVKDRTAVLSALTFGGVL